MLLKLFLLIFILFPSGAVFANGGDQRVVEGEYLINLSRAPFTPRVEEKTSFLVSFVDIEKNKLIQEDLVANIRIAKLGGIGVAKRTFVFEQENFRVEDGVLEFSYTFENPGLHEIFIDFAFALDSERVYESPDFLLDIQEQAQSEKPDRFLFISTMMGLTILGFLLGWITRGKVKKYNRRMRNGGKTI